MSIFYDIHGQIQDSLGHGVCGLYVTVYDRDLVRHDLLGIVQTDEQGVFQLRFTQDEFHQHPGERESAPDLNVIVWRRGEQGEPRFLVEVSLEHLEVAPGEAVDVGVIELGLAQDALVGDASREVVKGSRKRGLRLNAQVLDYAMRHALPLVRAHTGWEGLGEVECEFTARFAPITRVWAAYLERSLHTLSVSPWQDWLANLTEREALAGLYDPISKKIYLNTHVRGILGLESFIVLLGHELVHAGQFLHHPELLEWLQQAVERQQVCNALLEDGVLGADVVEFHTCVGVAPLMTDLEGYAFYVERDFLAQSFGSTLTPTTSLLQEVFTNTFAGVAPPDVARIKHRQYNLGRQEYLLQARPGEYARFEQGVFFAELPLLEQQEAVWRDLLGGDRKGAIVRHRALLKRHAAHVGKQRPRHDDVMFLHGVLLASDTDHVQQAVKHFERHVQAVRAAYGKTSPRALRAAYRAATTLELNGACAAAFAHYKPLADDLNALTAGLVEAEQWFDTGFYVTFMEHASEVCKTLRKGELFPPQPHTIHPAPT